MKGLAYLYFSLRSYQDRQFFVRDLGTIVKDIISVRSVEYLNARSPNPRLNYGLLSKFRIMALTLDYPDNWTESATTVKQAAGYRCNRCGLKCLPPTNSYSHLYLSLRHRLSAQVHHLDRNPAHNDRANLVCVCAGCHLRLHRHHPKTTLGQLSLKLKLPANNSSI